MRLFIHSIISALYCCFLPTFAAVDNINLEASSANINTKFSLTLLTGLPKPPFILDDGQSGLQLDIIKSAFHCQESEVTFVNIQLGRNITYFQSSGADGIITLPRDYDHAGLFLSWPYISYQNVVITLADKNINITDFADLSLLSIAAFQNAKKFLDSDYQAAIKHSIEYREIADQFRQITLLYQRRVEAIVLDLNIFNYFIKLNQAPMFQQKVHIHPLFGRRYYSIGFKSQVMRDIFNQGLDCIKTTGEYSQIMKNYRVERQ